MLRPVSRTFHGRDVFAPAAAHLALGVEPAELGPPLDPAGLVRLVVPEPEVRPAALRATILYVDRFGNMQLNLTREHAVAAGIAPGMRVELQLPLDRYAASVTATFGEAQPGDLLLYEDSYGHLAIAVTGGDAAGVVQAKPGDEVRIAVVPE